jgi:DNA-binding response OmpR family regulator
MKTHGIPLNGLETGTARVLVVDPDEQFTNVLSETLSNDERFEVRSTSSCFEAGILAAQMQPHAVLVDMNVPGASAKQFARAVRAHTELSETKLIATGAGLTTGQGESFVQEGFAHYLRKPFEVSDLVKLINGR